MSAANTLALSPHWQYPFIPYSLLAGLVLTSHGTTVFTSIHQVTAVSVLALVALILGIEVVILCRFRDTTWFALVTMLSAVVCWTITTIGLHYMHWLFYFAGTAGQWGNFVGLVQIVSLNVLPPWFLWLWCYRIIHARKGHRKFSLVAASVLMCASTAILLVLNIYTFAVISNILIVITAMAVGSLCHWGVHRVRSA
jgi:hypothetical protein